MRTGVTIPKYTSKDFPILVASMLPMAILLNYFLWGKSYFDSFNNFVTPTLVSFIILGFAFFIYGLVAIALRNRFPDDRQLLKRLTICISIFFLMSAVFISLILRGYDYFEFHGYEYEDSDFTKAYIAFIVINTFLTFMQEGVYRFEKFRATVTETEQLKKEYMHSQLLGLKSQMNPHFLFNSLNTLSSLIHEDADKAEDFLDHMSKVYRYLLRNNEDQLVSLDTELNFIRSYASLLKSRYGDALNIDIHVSREQRDQMIPPLTLQMLVENVLNQNSISKNRPLDIAIRLVHNWIEVRNKVQPKMSNNEEGLEVIDNISNKYRLLCGCDIVIKEIENERIIQLPLIPNKEMVAI
ncbi:MAG: sensor histidine kinase [Flavisolibacter sp.]